MRELEQIFCRAGRLKELGMAVGLVDESTEVNEAAARFVAVLRAMNARMGIPAKLEGIREEDIPALARHAAKESNPLYPVPVLMDAGELEQFYREVMA